MAACLKIIFSKQGLSFTIRSVAKLYDILDCFYQFRSIYDLKEIYDGKIHLFLVSIQRNYLVEYLWSIKSNKYSYELRISILTLSVPIPDEDKKLTYIFIFTLLCGASKGFMKALKALIKPFEARQRSVKNKNLS